MKQFILDQTINDDGTYTLNRSMTYFSWRYGKTVTCAAGMVSDGATDAMDIASRGWWFHDQLCNTGKWDDGTPISNWQCSQVLADIMAEEGRKWQSLRWQVGTFLFGGGEARKNGMFSVKKEKLLCVASGKN